MSKATEQAWYSLKSAQYRLNEAANRVAAIAAGGANGTLLFDEALAAWGTARVEAGRVAEAWAEASVIDRLALVAAEGGPAAWWAARDDQETLLAWSGGEVDALDAPLLSEVPC